MSKAPRSEQDRSPKPPFPSRPLPWFRLYVEFSGDPNIQSLSFEDQRHFVVLMCLKGAGVLDRTYPSADRRDAVIARGLGLDLEAAVTVLKRLTDAGILLRGWQPKGWETRQYESDSAAEKQRRYRDKQRALRNGEVTVTSQDSDTDSEADSDTDKKNLTATKYRVGEGRAR